MPISDPFPDDSGRGSDAPGQALIARMAAGDGQALREFCASTGPVLFGLCLRILGDRDLAQQVLQESWLRLWNAAGAYPATGLRSMTWAVNVTRAHAIDRLRARRGPAAPMDDIAELADLSPAPEDDLRGLPGGQRIAACLGTLDPDRAEAVRRAYLDGDTLADLSARYAVPPDTIRAWMGRGILRLGACLTG